MSSCCVLNYINCFDTKPDNNPTKPIYRKLDYDPEIGGDWTSADDYCCSKGDYDPEIGGDWTSADDYCCSKGDYDPEIGGDWTSADDYCCSLDPVCKPPLKNNFVKGDYDPEIGGDWTSADGYSKDLINDDPDSVIGPNRPIPWDNYSNIKKMEDLRCETCGKNFCQCICNEMYN
ncbi:hypothetical protein BCR32DRAFT_241130 [Anaeromyces robustus]|uniref:Uncharacterized protein n=1 Tax=Anaeromyces robustus TaxID=1754192 RepID=A0A1Y1XLB8_9FUNG|nr:hypothetical protein BCR32DRAFT_241130 [Anaeromyces robustus]|eukprot:ORX86276.1 hypothetical protein BCR32DRAFT_241130 [Anaeromyces robustus]